MTEVEIFKQNLDVSRITMYITIVMALTTVVFSALTMAFQRSHNKRSIRPFCNLRKTNVDGKVCISVKNSGLGPMKDATVSFVDAEGKPVDTASLMDAIKKLDKKAIVELCPIHGYTFLSSEEIFALAYSGNAAVADYLGGLSLSVTYGDVYERSYETKRGLAEL
jgi:hypothetical protein